MIVFKQLKFRKGIDYGTLSEFKRKYAGHLKDLSDAEVKECYDLLDEPKKTTKQRKTTNKKQVKK